MRAIAKVPAVARKRCEAFMAKTVLVVENPASIVPSISSILRGAGFDTDMAAHADEALGKLKRGVAYDLLITDLGMPGNSGIDLIRQVRRLDGGRLLPVLFLATESQQSRKVEAEAAGASGWIVRPVVADELFDTIRRVLH